MKHATAALKVRPVSRTSSGVALVTGGAGCLGRACAQELARHGMSVGVLDVEYERARHVVDELPAISQRHAAVPADVTSSESVARACASIREQLGEVSVLVNAAGIARSTRFDQISEEEWDEVLAVSVKGTFLICRALVPSMRRLNYGRIVNFSSTAGKSVSTLGGAHYTTAKAALLGFTRALASEVGSHGITVNAICPGLFDTDMAAQLASRAELDRVAAGFPVGRLGDPSEVGALVGFLCSERAGYITGATLDINGGDLMV